jgi:hypothetical protein
MWGTAAPSPKRFISALTQARFMFFFERELLLFSQKELAFRPDFSDPRL